jgi:predicted transcriptional regulator
VARTKSQTLTETELRLMEVLWNRGPSTAREVLDALPDPDSRAYSTVRTMLGVLEQKGYVTHREQGRAFVYEPRVERDQARASAVRHLVRRFFNDSPEQLVLNLIEDEQIDPGELARLKKMIEESDKEAPR